MSVSKIVKIPSRQNHVLTSSQNLVDFEIPSDIYDLSQSYVNLNVSVNSASSANIAILNLARLNAANAVQDTNFSNVSFVRHASIKSDRNGTLESLRHVNVLKENLKAFDVSRAKQFSQDLTSRINPLVDKNMLTGCPFRDFYKEGTTLTKELSHNVMIPLPEIFDVCNIDSWNSESMGKLSAHLELDLDSFGLKQYLDNTDSAKYWTSVMPGQTETNGAMADFADGATVLITKRTYNSPDDSPFYVGQGLTITGTANVPANTTRQITGLNYRGDNKFDITISASIATTGGNNATGVTVKGINDAKASAQIIYNSCELVLMKNSVSKPLGGVEYITYEVEEDSLGNVAQVNKDYMLNSNCQNVYMVFPSDNKIILSNRQINSYRFSIDGVNSTNRRITTLYNSGLHLNQLMKVFENGQYEMENTRKSNININQIGVSLESAATVNYMIAEAIPLKGSPTQFNIDVTGNAANLDRMLLFKEIVRKL